MKPDQVIYAQIAGGIVPALCAECLYVKVPEYRHAAIDPGRHKCQVIALGWIELPYIEL